MPGTTRVSLSPGRQSSVCPLTTNLNDTHCATIQSTFLFGALIAPLDQFAVSGILKGIELLYEKVIDFLPNFKLIQSGYLVRLSFPASLIYFQPFRPAFLIHQD
jgi:hypothetical protein